MFPLPQASSLQLSSADSLADADLGGDLVEAVSASAVNSLSMCNSKLSELNTNFDQEKLSSGFQVYCAFLQGSLGMDHPESFIDPETDLLEQFFSEHLSVYIFSPSDHNSYKIILQNPYCFFLEPSSKEIESAAMKSFLCPLFLTIATRSYFLPPFYLPPEPICSSHYIIHKSSPTAVPTPFSLWGMVTPMPNFQNSSMLPPHYHIQIPIHHYIEGCCCPKLLSFKAVEAHPLPPTSKFNSSKKACCHSELMSSRVVAVGPPSPIYQPTSTRKVVAALSFCVLRPW